MCHLYEGVVAIKQSGVVVDVLRQMMGTGCEA